MGLLVRWRAIEGERSSECEGFVESVLSLECVAFWDYGVSWMIEASAEYGVSVDCGVSGGCEVTSLPA